MDKWLVIGLGNPILGDDGVGWKVAEALQDHFKEINPPGPFVADIETLSLGGLSLMEHMVGYKRVILIDAIDTGQQPAGQVSVFPLSELADPSKGHTTSAHDASLMTSLKTGHQMGLDLPAQVIVVAIEARKLYDFSDSLSEPVEKSVKVALKKVLDILSMASA